MNEQSSNQTRPLGGYGLLTGIYLALTGAFLARTSRSRSELPGTADVVLIGIATHKLSRAITKDKVTSPLRAPFTDYEGEAGPGEVSESPQGEGLRYAIGELLVCPYCIAHWVATGLIATFAVSPRAARLIASIFTAVTASDFLQIAYKVGEDKL